MSEICISGGLVLLGLVGLGIYAVAAVAARSSLLDDEETELRRASEVAKGMSTKGGMRHES